MAETPLDFKTLFEQAPSLFLILRAEPKFTILGASDAYLKATMTKRENIVGRDLFEIFPDNPDDPQATGTSKLAASLQRVLTSKSSDAMAVQKYDIRRPESEGGGFEERFWSPCNSPVLSSEGQILYVIHRVEDVTDFIRVSRQKEAQQEISEDLRKRNEVMELEILRRSQELDDANSQLRQTNQRLSELDKAKTDFFNNVSHEFRTPLTLILGPLEAILADNGELRPALRERLELIYDNATRLLKLVNMLLDFTRIEAGRTTASFSPTDLASFTRELAGIFESTITKAGVSLKIDCAPLSEPAFVDRDMWEKIVLNLLSNAFKFTFQGEISIALRETAESFELIVKDTGVGIPKRELPRIFERFYRVSGTKSRSHEGTGIGLSFVKELVQLHGGTIAVNSVENIGSTFVVTLPKGNAHLPATAPHSDAQDRGAASKKRSAFVQEAMAWLRNDERPAVQKEDGNRPRILLADDNADLRHYVGGLLAPHFSVEAVADGLAALVAATERKPDLVLSDVMMPELDGIGLLRALRADARTRDVPVILLSARAGTDASSEGLEAGADDYLIKPFSSQELLARVRTHLALNKMRHAWANELEIANKELEAFSSAASHDMQKPLRSISIATEKLLASCGEKLNAEELADLRKIREKTQSLFTLISDLLNLSRITHTTLRKRHIDVSTLASSVVDDFKERNPDRAVRVEIQPSLTTFADAHLLGIVLENLIGNAWKFTGNTSDARIKIGQQSGDQKAFFVRDNGAGFEMAYAHKLFSPFQRLHPASQFDGTGIGLVTVHRIITRHGGKVWCEAAPDQGATFFFTLPESD